MTSYCADEEKFMDRRTDRHRQRQCPFGLKYQGVKTYSIQKVGMLNVDSLFFCLISGQRNMSFVDKAKLTTGGAMAHVVTAHAWGAH